MTDKSKGGRPRGPRIDPLASGKKGARVTLVVDGETIRRRVKFDTTDQAVAKKKLERLIAEELPPEAVTGAATFWEEMLVVYEEMVARGVHRPDIELGRVKNHVRPFVGKLSRLPFGERVLSKITSEEVTEVLVSMRERGYSKQQVKHARNTMRRVFEARKLRTMEHAPLPLFKATIAKARAVASDAILIAYLSWEHPVARHRAAVRMRQTMSAVARCLGGQRTNDLHTETWEDNFVMDDDGTFSEAWVPRTKTMAPQRMEVPPALRPFVHLWWEHQGRPKTGPIFPLLRGENAGKARETQDSHADALRRDLKRALGLEVWDGARWQPGRAPTRAERELFEESKYTLPVDFHSWRRAWSQALEAVSAEIGLPLAARAELTGHGKDGRTHGRYLDAPHKLKAIPAGAVPLLVSPSPAENPGDLGFGQLPAETPGSGVSPHWQVLGYTEISSAPAGIRTQDPWLRRPTDTSFLPVFSHGSLVPEHEQNHEKRPGTPDVGLNSRPILSAYDYLCAAMSCAVDAHDWKLADLIRPALDRAEPKPVTELSVVRGKRGDK